MRPCSAGRSVTPDSPSAKGDIRALCDLFGMSIANAARWATTVGPDLRHKNS